MNGPRNTFAVHVGPWVSRPSDSLYVSCAKLPREMTERQVIIAHPGGEKEYRITAKSPSLACCMAKDLYLSAHQDTDPATVTAYLRSAK